MPGMSDRHELLAAEGKTLERKRDATPSDSILRTVVAFANSAGGRLVIGVTDDGEVIGVEDPISVEEQLTIIVSHGVSPLLVPDVSITTIDEGAVVVLTVYPSGRRPHHVAGLGSGNGTYVRVGASNRLADRELRRELARSGAPRGFDAEPAAGIGLDALDRALLPDGVIRTAVSSNEALRLLDLVTAVDAEELPTNAGVLLLAPTVIGDRFPDAVVHALVFEGEGPTPRGTGAALRRTIGGCLFQMLERTEAFVVDAIGERISIEPGRLRHTRTSLVPAFALRELLVNAFVHADYSTHGGPFRVAVFRDRLVIENPGLLPPGISVEDLGGGVSRVRNRAIARVFREAGMIEQWGSGIMRAREACTAAGLRPPTFEELAPYRFRATIHLTPVAPPALDDADERLIAAVRAALPTGLATAALAAATGRSERSVRDRMRRLVQLGLVQVEGAGPRRRYVSKPD